MKNRMAFVIKFSRAVNGQHAISVTRAVPTDTGRQCGPLALTLLVQSIKKSLSVLINTCSKCFCRQTVQQLNTPVEQASSIILVLQMWKQAAKYKQESNNSTETEQHLSCSTPYENHQLNLSRYSIFFSNFQKLTRKKCMKTSIFHWLQAFITQKDKEMEGGEKAAGGGTFSKIGGFRSCQQQCC